MLTKKQQVLLAFIHQRLQEEGVPPSFEEMKLALDLKSKSGIHRLITALEERGFIKRLPNRARALEVIKLPDAMAMEATNTQNTPQSSAEVIKPDFGHSGPTLVSNNEGNNIAPFPSSSASHDEEPTGFNVPVMGKIAAGVPIAAIQDNTHSIAVPPEMIGSGDHFALTVEGDSMIEAGILDGDTVIIRQESTARGGEIVVALVDDEEATLKTFKREGNEIALIPANRDYETRLLTSDRVKVQGKLVGLVRQYH